MKGSKIVFLALIIIINAVLAVNVFAYDLKFKGDFRFRYQWQENTAGNMRSRERIRIRFGVNANPNEYSTIGFGFASGSNDPRSTNATLDNAFDTKSFNLDYAYAEIYKNSNLKLWLGKYKGIKKCIWIASDLLWDGDLRPEGAGIIFNKNLNGISVFTNAGMWMLDEIRADDDPVMGYIQPGIKIKLNDMMQIKMAAIYYPGFNIQGNVLPYSSETNTLINDTLTNNYSSFGGDFAISMYDVGLPLIEFFGSFVMNSEIDSLNKGYLGGIKFGSKKTKKLGDWQIKYMYRYLQRDAWLDIFPDSDANDGETQVDGHEIVLSLGLMKNLTFSCDYYYMGVIDADKGHLLQADLVWKF